MQSAVWSPPPSPALSQTEVHLWYVFPDALTDPELLDSYQDLLCPEERAQRRERLMDVVRDVDRVVTEVLGGAYQLEPLRGGLRALADEGKV